MISVPLWIIANNFRKISATIDGQVVSWQNNWPGDKAASPPAASPSSVWVTATIDGQVVSWVNNWFGSSSTAAPQVPSSVANSIKSSVVLGMSC
jgi:hypothetical protein